MDEEDLSCPLKRCGVYIPQATERSAKPERTVVVCGIPDGLLSEDIMADILMINFQKTKNNGGDVEDIDYPISTKGVAYITFEDKQVAENVLRKGKLILEDKRLHKAFFLKVSPYGGSVFTCVTCTLDLSSFEERCNLEDLVQKLEENLPNLSFGPLHTTRQITVQGPFPDIKILQNKLALILKRSFLEQPFKRKGRVPDNRSRMKPRNHGLPFKSRNGTVENPSEEGLTIALDTDIYHYMKKFKSKLYQKNLEKYGVTSYESVDGEVTIIYLCNSSAKSDSSQLEHAKNTIEGLLTELHSSLRKGRLFRKGPTRTEKQEHEQACELVNKKFPNVLIIPYPTHIDIIGSSSDIYEFAQQVNKMMGSFQKEPWI
ncbi:RNA-binding protein 43 isoform X2 [Python bivittatus]|uniref:RNA-binding protein 43 isoform X2 n=1 Tax=Python bivittatus TaxID=176946 RepID=A0A9F5IGQ8_PYTBI|nr:RNA-binding protein 43 isoform X2 [Python bivittatus]